MTLEIPWALLGMRFGLDATTRVFLGFTLLLWLLAALYAFGYVRARRRAFAVYFGATFAGNLGLILAQDAASFYLFFALMTFAAYGLVVHERTPAALRAGRVYIVLAVLGEALLLAGLILCASSAESLSFQDLRASTAGSAQRDVIVALLFAGFGVKAGVLGLHMWLPLAHPVAPTPASAVLSGAMIKAGLLGWLQFLPLGEAALPGWGAALAALGIAAALAAALVGIAQDDPKTVLAYSSVSQMGLMTVAVGAGLAFPDLAGAAVAAAALYALHHGLAKGTLFLGVGAFSRSALAWLALALPALALAGLPFTSGAGAKYALKGVLDDWAAAQALLSFAALGTALLMARFLFLMARHDGAHPHPLARGAWLATVAASLAAAALVTVPEPSWSDLWPLAAGALIATAFAVRGGRWRRLRVAPGDLLLPLEAAAAACIGGAAAAARALEARARRAFETLSWREAAWAARMRDAASAGEARLLAAGLKAGLVVLALLLALAWR
jgi:formate hydrogenlyase subunit 3/multisubunit Na+/H+ antiporter MnhD subunit